MSALVQEIAIKLLAIMATLAERTTTKFDDVAVSILQKLVADESTWKEIWNLISSLLDANATSPDIRTNSDVIAFANKVADADDAEISPIIIIEFIITIVELIRKWFNR